jgi:hypothetical protein
MHLVGKVHLALCFLAGLGVFGAVGCGSFEKGATGSCTDLVACGGSPVGSWTSIVDSCQFQPVRPAQAIDVTEFTQNSTGPMAAMIPPPQPNPVVTQQTTSGDWCSSLVYNPDNSVSNVQLWHDAPILDAANITYGPDMSYLTTLTFSTKGFPVERNTTHFPLRCLVANGAPPPPSCSMLAAGLTTFYKPQSAGVPPNFDQIACVDDHSDKGCTCTYVYTVVVSDQGMWKVEGTTLLQDSAVFLYNGAMVNSQSPASTLQSTFCSQNGRLQLTGLSGGSLFGVLGLRTLELSQTQP